MAPGPPAAPEDSRTAMTARFDRVGVLLLLLVSAPAAAQLVPPPEPPRIVIIKADGLSPWVVEAAVRPDDDRVVNQLENPEEFRHAVARFRQALGRQQLLPNIERYFFREGVRADQMYSATVTLSAVAWSVVDTGQPSIVKGHGVFERNTGYMRSYLDFLRDTLDFAKRRGDKTLGVWVLDQAGVSLTTDAFDPARVWMAPQMYIRPELKEYLAALGLDYIRRGHKFSEPRKILKTQLGRRAGDPRHVEWGESFMMRELSQQILVRDYTQHERYDLLSGFFTQMDHQQHSEPSPEGLLSRLVHFDELLGQVFATVEQSERRNQTFVVIVSDHGQEFTPGLTAVSVPLTRLFRTRLFGGHTTQTLLSEETDRALTVPMPGVDYPRVYESDYSPYGAAAPKGKGEKGWPTAYVEPFGNARAEVHLRNNDLNRLHLLLLAVRRGGWQEAEWGRLDDRLQETLTAINRWLPAKLRGMREYYEGARNWNEFLQSSADPYLRDTGARLQIETERLQPQIKALTALQGWIERSRAHSPLRELGLRSFKIYDFIPRKFYGPRNSFHQLTHYTVGLDMHQEWVETTVDAQGRQVPMDYFQILSDYEVANPPVPGNRNPFDLMVYALSGEAVAPLLIEKGVLAPTDALEDALWVRATTRNNPAQSGEALILRRTDGDIKYVVVTGFEQSADGQFSFERNQGPDPLALLADPNFLQVAGPNPTAWFAEWHSDRVWLEATHRTRYTDAVLVFLDVAGRNYRRFMRAPEFERTLVGFSSDELKQRYLRGLEQKYAGFMADLWVWSSKHFNFSSKGPEPAGAHGGLGWQVARTSFFVWGGEQTGLRRGALLTEPATTLDVAPTILCMAGRLAPNGAAGPPRSVAPPRSQVPLPGRVLDIFMPPHACLASSAAEQIAARE